MKNVVKKFLILFGILLITLSFKSVIVYADASNFRQYNGLDYRYISIVGSSGYYGSTSIAGNFGALDGNGGNNAIGYTNNEYWYAKQRLIDTGRIINKSQIVSIEIIPASYNSNARFYLADNNQTYVDTGITFSSSNGVQSPSIFILGANLPVENVRYMKTTSSSCNDGEQIVIHLRDNVAPGLSLTPNTTNWTNGSVTINANSWDNIGIQAIQTPDGNWTNTSNLNYTVSTNGTYYFSVKDTSGNVSTNSINISNIEQSPPTITSLSIQNQDENGYDVYVYGVSDINSGVNRVQFPTWTDYNGQDDIQPNWWSNSSATGTNLGGGTWKYHVNKSDHNNELGAYNTHVYVYDNAGNYNSLTTALTLKWNDDATITSNDIPSNMETGKSYTVHVTVKNTGNKTWDSYFKLGAVGESDPLASTRQYLSSGTTVAPGSSYTFAFVMTAPATPGTYTTDWQMVHEGVKWFGNAISKNIVVTDTTLPTVSITPNNFNPSSVGWTNKAQTIVINASDSGSGVKNIKLPNGNYVTGSTANYIISSNGTYTFNVADNSNNVVTNTIVVSNIDTTLPTVNIAKSTEQVTNQTYRI